MAEVMGVIASILTITQTIHPILSLAQTVYRAQNELSDLQTDLKVLAGFLEAIKHRHSNRFNSHLSSALYISLQTIEELKAVIQDKLLRSDNGKLRPVSWLIYKKKIETLQSRLRDSKQTVLAAVSIETFETSVRLDATLLDISSQTRAIQGILLRMDRALRQEHQSSNIRPSRQRINNTVSSSVTTDVSESGLSENNDELFRPIRCAQPLEYFPNDYPEIYGDVMLPKLILTALYEETSSRFSRINCYRMLFQRSPRQWIHLSISLEIPSDAKYWMVAALPRYSNNVASVWYSHFTPFKVPTSLLYSIQRALERRRADLGENSYFRLWLSNEGVEGPERREEFTLIPPGFEGSRDPMGCPEKATLSSFYHLGCRKISARQVIQLAPIEYPYCFVAIFEGQLVAELKSEQQPAGPTAEFCYNIEIIHCLRDKPGVVRLLGLVVDDQLHLRSYLLKLPDTECEFVLDHASRLSQSWNWQQVESLAWQLIHRISAVHTAGQNFVVGTLWQLRPPILVDARGQLHLYLFRKRLEIRGTAVPFYPPEFDIYAQRYSQDSRHTERPLLTKEFDIYQMGHLLWILAENWATNQSPQTLKEMYHSALYSRPAGSPKLSEKVPEYFRSIVQECCSEDPYSRPLAVELLSRFPATSFETMSGAQDAESERRMDINGLQKCRIRTVCCDLCGMQMASVAYNCTRCTAGDFDLCRQCFDEGKHCKDSSHLLRENTVSLVFEGMTSYYSCVDSLGTRHVVEV